MTLRYLATPDDAAERPMMLLLHGRGADMHDLFELAPHLGAEEGIRFVFPNAPKPWEPYPGQSFGWTWFEGWPPSHESVTESRASLLRFLDDITARFPTPDGGLILGGFSQGAMMSLDAGLRTEKKLAAIVALSGGLYEADLPDLSSRKDLPVFLAHGTLDDVVPVHYARRARGVLEDAGLAVEYREYPMGHQIAMEELAALKRFVHAVAARSPAG